MEEKLEAFAAKCHQIQKADSGPSGIEEVRSNLEPLLSDENFVSIYLGPENNEIRKILYEDKELGFCILAHVYKGASNSPPHDHGPSWAIYGQAAGKTEMTEYDKVKGQTDDEMGLASPKKNYILSPGMAVAYNIGDLHSPKRESDTRLIRMEGKNLEGVKRDKYKRV